MINMYSGNSVIANLLMRFPVLIPIAVGSAIAVTTVKVVVPSFSAPAKAAVHVTSKVAEKPPQK